MVGFFLYAFRCLRRGWRGGWRCRAATSLAPSCAAGAAPWPVPGAEPRPPPLPSPEPPPYPGRPPTLPIVLSFPHAAGPSPRRCKAVRWPLGWAGRMLAGISRRFASRQNKSRGGSMPSRLCCAVCAAPRRCMCWPSSLAPTCRPRGAGPRRWAGRWASPAPPRRRAASSCAAARWCPGSRRSHDRLAPRRRPPRRPRR